VVPGNASANGAHRTPGRERDVQIAKQDLLSVLRTEGDNDTADRVESTLPDQIDTDQHGDALDAAGLDRTQLMAKLAGAGFGGTIAP
jgi:hypothetical protein